MAGVSSLFIHPGNFYKSGIFELYLRKFNFLNKIIFLFVTIISFSGFAQGEANNWYFGRRAGLTFNTNPPSALTDGQLNTSEGCSSMSDINGDLLMYTDGRTIWDKEHNIMPGADYFGTNGLDGLNGDPSSTSSGLIVPHPTELNLYYIFTVDEPHHDNANAYPNQGPADEDGNPIPFYTDVESHFVPQDDDGFNNGLNYTIVDMNLRGGLGDVVPSEKNIQLITYDTSNLEEVKYKASEKITAVRGSDCNSVWLITHFKNKYYSFLINEFGIDPTPVISQVIPNIPTSSYRRGAIGYLKASPNGERLLVAHFTTSYDRNSQDVGRDGAVYLYDFNNVTGVVSNSQKLVDNCNPYGVEFSPNGTKVYATLDDGENNIYQWNLENTPISNSKFKINSVELEENSSALQLGPDGRIYQSIINSGRLAVINNPNALGPDIEYIPNTNLNSVGLGGRSTSFGLPPFIQSLFSERINIVNDDQDNIPTEVNLCDETEFLLSYNTSPGATYTWKKDGEILSDENGSSLLVEVPPDAEYPYEVTFQLEVNFNDGECPLVGIARLTFNQSPDYGNQELVTCRETTEDTPVYDFTDIYTQLSDAFDIPLEEIAGIFYETEDDAINGENPITEISNFQNTTGISSIYAEMETFQSCKEIIEINLLVEEFPDIFLEDESLILCQENSDGILLDASGSEEENTLEYLWSTGETSAQITVDTGGEYTVDVSFQGFECALSKTFTVIESNIASFDFEVESSGNSNSIQIITDSSSLGEYEFAINEPVNFQDSSTFENLSPGVYQVYVRDQLGCGVSEKTIGVLGIMEFFTPNGDGINDVWQISGLLQTNEEDILLQVYDRYGKLLSSFTNRDRGWNGTYNGKNMPTDDYWYRIRLTDGTIETGSFTLKR